MPGYWDLVKMQPGMMQAGVQLGSSIGDAFARSKEQKMREAQLDMQRSQIQAKQDQEQAMAQRQKSFDIAASARQRASTPEAIESSERRMYQVAPAMAQEFMKRQQGIEAFGQPEPVKPTNLARNLEEAGYVRGTPEFASEMRRLLNKRSAGVNVTIGQGKPLGEATVRDLSSIDAAVKSVKSLKEVWDKTYSGNTPLDVGVNWFKKHAPAGMTPESLYEMRKTIVTQNLGRMLEGGVLREPDFKRYVSMIPGPDMVGEAGEQMWGDLVRELESLTESKENRLRASGYSVPGGGGAQEDFTQMSDEELQRIVRGK